MSAAVPFVLFVPILLSITKSRPGMSLINLTAVTSFSAGFIWGGNSNIWPIALGVWIVLSIPAIVVFNVAAIIYIKKHDNSATR